MPEKDDTFHLSGPVHLKTVDWANPNHQRTVAASLVKGVYVFQRDRMKRREGSRALAPPWWETFHFQLHEPLIDKDDSSVFGAIYQLITSVPSADQAPRYVIAFRGTIPKLHTFKRDLKLNIRIITNRLDRTPRAEEALQAVQRVVAEYGSSNVWVAGHSQGAAMVMLAGKCMAKTGDFLEAFLFNPPFVSPPIGRMKGHGVRLARSVITAGLLKMKHRSGSSSAALSAWQPRLFVNRADWICAEYIGYFEHREWMEKIGAGEIERMTSQHSVSGLLVHAIASKMGKPSSEEPLHLIPSASLTVNHSPVGRRNAHGIKQWWGPDLLLESKTYNYM